MSTTAFAVPFDTLAFVKKLETAGVPSSQAEAQAEALSEVLQKVEENRKDELATRRDIDDLRRDIDTKLEKMELRMVIKMAGMILASVGMIIGYLRAFPMPVQIVQPPVQEMRLPAPAPSDSLAPPSAPTR